MKFRFALCHSVPRKNMCSYDSPLSSPRRRGPITTKVSGIVGTSLAAAYGSACAGDSGSVRAKKDTDARLLRLDIGLACDLAPFLELGLDQGRERLRRGALGLGPVLSQLLFHLLGL